MVSVVALTGVDPVASRFSAGFGEGTSDRWPPLTTRTRGCLHSWCRMVGGGFSGACRYGAGTREAREGALRAERDCRKLRPPSVWTVHPHWLADAASKVIDAVSSPFVKEIVPLVNGDAIAPPVTSKLPCVA